ncbi:MAG: cyclase family protein [Bacillota bacterium]
MDKLIDLSHLIRDGMPAYPGDPDTRLTQIRHLETDLYNNHSLHTGMHSGTHIDAPMHLTKRDEYISELPLQSFIGAGCVLDVRGQMIIGMREEYRQQISEKSIVLLYTGWDQHWGTDTYFGDHPVVDAELAAHLIEKQVKLLGVDTPSPDHPPCAIHKQLFAKDIYIMENLTNLGSLLSAGRFEVIALPLRIRADASIARAIARVKE